MLGHYLILRVSSNHDSRLLTNMRAELLPTASYRKHGVLGLGSANSSELELSHRRCSRTLWEASRMNFSISMYPKWSLEILSHVINVWLIYGCIPITHGHIITAWVYPVILFSPQLPPSMTSYNNYMSFFCPLPGFLTSFSYSSSDHLLHGEK